MQDQKVPAYRLSVEDVLENWRSKRSGLNNREVLNRLTTFGPNTLHDLKKETIVQKYFRQYKDFLILLLLGSSIIAFYLEDTRVAAVLFGLVIFNTFVGFFQEYRAEKTMKALEKLVKAEAEVFRDNKLHETYSSELVPGDIVRVSEGDSVPADIRMIDTSSFATNDFALTGESQPTRKFTHVISKNVPIANRHNLAYMGTTVATGEAVGIVIATGMNTELGRIANLSANAPHEMSPLQREMAHIGKLVATGVVFICIALLLIALKFDLALKDAFLFAVGVASSLVPNGLPAEINASLAQAASKLSKAKALVKRLSAVESLGATHIICTDKTGTLTKNEMTVESLIIGREEYVVEGTGYEAKGTIVHKGGKVMTKAELAHEQQFFATGALASNAKVLPPDNEHAGWFCLGDPTEGALITLARKAGIDLEEFDEKYPEFRELSFDSARKRMTSLREFSDGKAIAYVKGAPESILERCSHIFDGEKIRPLTKHDREWFLQEHTNRASEALRNLGFAMRTLSLTEAKHGDIDDIESDLTLLGMVSIIDPLREAVPAAMLAARRAHIKVNVITGDFALTAEAIARKAGLVAPNEALVVVSGEELADMSDQDVLSHVLKGGAIFSRVNPEDKMRIVELIKKSNHVVAVTGDGINDAPALKRADIGVAMGITGTDVAKQSAEIILLDDSFSTLISAVQSGRTIFANIKKAVLNSFSANASELVVILASVGATALSGIPMALGVLQLLAIDLVAEFFPVAALGWDKAEGELMKDKPRRPQDHILNVRNIIDLFWTGLLIGGFAFINYLFVFQRAGENPQGISTQDAIYLQATTVTYLTLVVCLLVNVIQRRSVKGFFSRYQFSNRYFWLAILLSTFCVLNIVYNPTVADFFRSGPVTLIDWAYVFIAAIIFLAIRELQRLFHYHVVSQKPRHKSA